MFLQLPMCVFFRDDERGVIRGGGFKHGIRHDGLDDGAQTACAKAIRLGFLHDIIQGIVFKLQCLAIKLEQMGILLDYRILRLGQDIAKRSLVERIEIGEHGQTTDELGDESERLQV